MNYQIQGKNSIARRVEDALCAVLPRSVTLQLIKTKGSTVELAINGQKYIVRWVREGWLPAIQQVLSEHRPNPDIVVSRRMGPASRSLLSEAGVGWIDEAGAAEVVSEGLIISRSGKSNQSKKSGWTRSVLSVAEALLCGAKATVTGMTAATGLSTGACTKALRMLSDSGYLTASSARGPGSARHVADSDALLASYIHAAETLKRPLAVQVGVTWQDAVDGLAKLGQKFDESGVEWAASGQVAAAVIAPLITSVRSALVYVNAETSPMLEAIATRMDLQPIEGGRLMLRPVPTSTTLSLSSMVDGLHVAPWPRIYVDLRSSGVRGEEAAEHLREVVNG
jgi:hypothetical protein